MKAKMIISGALAALTLVTAAGVAFADSPNGNAQMALMVNPNGMGHLTGTVASVSISTLSVNSWSGVWSVDASKATFGSRGNAGSFGDIKVGDLVTINGTFATSSLSVTARSIKDKSLVTNNKTVSGTVSNASSTGFTLTSGNMLITVTESASTTIMAGGNATTSTAIMNGDKVQVRGIFNAGTSTLAATRITILPVRVRAGEDLHASANINGEGNGLTVGANLNIGTGSDH